MTVYSVHDVVSGVFSEPIVEYNDDTAIRGFEAFARQYQFRNDVELVALADWDNMSGAIKPYPNYIVILRGAAIAAESEVSDGSIEV